MLLYPDFRSQTPAVKSKREKIQFDRLEKIKKLLHYATF